MFPMVYPLIIVVAAICTGMTPAHSQMIDSYHPSVLKSPLDFSPAAKHFVDDFTLRNIPPDFVKYLATLEEVEREVTLKGFLREVSSEDCREDVLTGFTLMAASLVTGNIPPTWLLHMMDSWGKIPSGLLSGNTQSSGDFLECIDLRASYYSLGSSQQKEFRGSYCSIYLVPSYMIFPPNETVHVEPAKSQMRKTVGSLGEFWELLERPDVNMIPFLGTCLPSSCSMEDQQIFLAAVVGAVSNSQLFPLVVSCQTGEKPEFSSGTVAMITTLVTIGSLCILGTLVDLVIRHERNAVTDDTNAFLDTLKKVFLSFSVYTNTEKLLNTDAGKGTLGCIHGLRFLSMAWVVCGHTLYMTLSSQNWNTVDLKKIYSMGWPAMTLLNATVSVDTFFVMSGLLVAYNLLRELDKTKGFAQFALIKVPLMYLQRYLRLTPTYLILLGIVATLYPYFSSGPLWYIIDGESQVCAEKWWHNILYINNIVDGGGNTTMCYGESWYLANDMQFFILSPLIIYPLWVSQWVGFLLLAGLSMGTLFANFYITGTKHITPTLLPNIPDVNYAPDIYMQPWTRIGPYLVGIFVGYLLYAMHGKSVAKKTMPKWVVISGWTLSTITALAIVIGPYDLFDPKNEEAARNSFRALLYAGLHRYIWACVIGWIIYACVQGQGGIVNRILSWEAFIPLGRLSYCIYIASYHIQLVYHLTLLHPTHFSMYISMHNFFAHLVFQLMIGFFLTVTIESPFLNLTKLIFR